MRFKLLWLFVAAFVCLFASAAAEQAADITAQCGFRGAGEISALHDGTLLSMWKAPRDDSRVTVTLPDGVSGSGIYVRWMWEPSGYVLEQYNARDELIASTGLESSFVSLVSYFPLEVQTAKTVLVLPKGANIGEISVFGEGELPDYVQVWEPPYEDADLMLIVAHQDDEELWFGGLIPYYDVVLDKKLSVVYMTNCSGYRRHEALTGLWNMGVRTYPVFLNYRDEYVSGGRDTALINWGGQENVMARLVELFEAVRPEVIITHDIAGEYGHPQHRATSYVVELAARQVQGSIVKKLYRHLGTSDTITLDWSVPSERLGGLTPLEAACIGFEAHASQHQGYSMADGVKYDYTKFSLVFSTVGADTAKNDFLENISFDIQ